MADPNSSCSPPLPQPFTVAGSQLDAVLSKSEFLTRKELLSRRSRRVKQLAQIYKDHYWSLMEDLKSKHREYYWLYGKSPFKKDEKKHDDSIEDTGENVHAKLGLGSSDDQIKRCVVAGCKAKAMALTRFCHPHILSDSKQKLYKACSYVVKSSQAGPIFCGKPVLKSTVPSLCPTHFKNAEKQVARALKKAGLNVASSSKVAPKLHVVVAEYVRQIKTKRRALQRENAVNPEIEEEKDS